MCMFVCICMRVGVFVVCVVCICGRPFSSNPLDGQKQHEIYMYARDEKGTMGNYTGCICVY